MWKIEKIIKKGDYLYAKVLGHPNATKHGYVLEHRIVMENYLERLLNKSEIVHQLNGRTHEVDLAISENILCEYKGKRRANR